MKIFNIACSGTFSALALAVTLTAQTVYIPSGTSGIGSSSNSNVGIGTSSSPSVKFQVNGSVAVQGSASYPTSGAGFEFVPSSATGVDSIQSYNRDTSAWRELKLAGSALSLYTNGTERMRIDSSGNVGIGTSSPGGSLDVRGAYSYFGSGQGYSYIRDDSLNFRNDVNGQSAGYINYYGYAGGTTQYRDLGIYNGRSGLIAHFQGSTGNVGIGTTSPGSYKLAVNGSIRAKEVVVDTGWSDYVFGQDYRLAPLSEVEQHIKAKKHLPGIPSAQEVADHGVSLGEMQSRLLAKVEELTLHLIAQEKRIAQLEQENAALQKR